MCVVFWLLGSRHIERSSKYQNFQSHTNGLPIHSVFHHDQNSHLLPSYSCTFTPFNPLSSQFLPLLQPYHPPSRLSSPVFTFPLFPPSHFLPSHHHHQSTSSTSKKPYPSLHLPTHYDTLSKQSYIHHSPRLLFHISESFILPPPPPPQNCIKAMVPRVPHLFQICFEIQHLMSETNQINLSNGALIRILHAYKRRSRYC